MKRPTFPPNIVIREGDDPTLSAAAYDLESLWTGILGLVVGLVLGFVTGWWMAADFIHG